MTNFIDASEGALYQKHRMNLHCLKKFLLIPSLLLVGCGYSTPVQRYSERTVKFHKPAKLMSNNYPTEDIYSVFEQGATGFVTMSSIREDLELQAQRFAERQGKSFVILGSNMSKPPYILGNFPRMEIIFALIPKPKS